MKHQKSTRKPFFLLLILGLILSATNAEAKKIYLNKMPDNGIYINGATFSYAPGDTLVLRASHGPYSYLDMTSFNGTAANPLVIINEGGQVHIQVIRLRHCNFIKVKGNGSSNQYGFYMTSTNINSPAFSVSGRSSNVEISHADINNHGYGFWVKEEGSCDDSLQHPNWIMENFQLHNNRVANTHYSGFYIGSTDPSGTRPYTCNGVTKYPLPLRLGNVKIYNNIIDRTGRGGIQMSATQFGTNEIYNNTITNVGLQLDGQQGNGIVLGGYTTANIYNNTINNTLASGIYSLGAGLVKIENNSVNNSGNLNGHTTTFAANIFIDTRPTSPVMITQFVIRNNTLGSHTGDRHIRVHKSYDTYSTNNTICGNTAMSGSLKVHVDLGILWTGCTANLPPIVNPGPNQVVVLPQTGVNLLGSATDPDGTVEAYQWTKVSGPASGTIAYPGSPQTMVNNLSEGIYVFRLSATDNQSTTGHGDVTVTVTSNPTTSPAPLPSPSPAPGATNIKIEAEHYSSMFGIQTEPTSDVGGGMNVGWQDNNDWMNYSVNVPAAGTYTINFRVASFFSNATFQLRNGAGNALATVVVPNTGGFQNWTTVSAQATLPAGQQTLRLFTTAANGGWNINWWEIVGAGTTTTAPANQAPVANAGANQTITLPTSSVTLNGSGTDADGTIASYAWTKVSGPSGGTISSPSSAQTTINSLQQGTYVYRLTVTDNAGATGSADVTITVNAATTSPAPTPTNVSIKIEAEHYSAMNGIQTEPTSDVGGGMNVGWQDNNDWMDYAVNMPAAGTFTVNFRVASYFSNATFQLRNAAGNALATVVVPNTGGFQNWTTVSVQATLPAGQQTLRLFTTAANGGWNINWWEIVGAGTTTTAPANQAPVANAGASQTITLPTSSVTLNGSGTDADGTIATYAWTKVSGPAGGTISSPSSAQTTINSLQQGTYVYRLTVTDNAGATGSADVTITVNAATTSTTPTTSVAIKIEAEHYTSMAGIQTEPTSDVGGGLNVGWQDNNDWMDYAVNMPAAGTFTVNFRVASFFTGATFQLRNASGTVLATVVVPNTGNFQSWTTVSAQATLPAGQQTLRIFTSAANGGWNINWWEIRSTATASMSVNSSTMEEAPAATASQIEIFPNPVIDKFMLQVNNNITGQLKVQIINMSGSVVREFNLNKSGSNSQFYLSIGDLPVGQYILRAAMKDWVETKQIQKN